MRYDLFANPRAVASIPAEAEQGSSPIDYHRTVPGYQPTPLLDAPRIAQALGVARVLVKDESTRLGLPSFKMLGASWATAFAVRREWLGGIEESLSPEQLRQRIPDAGAKRLVAATDGNHGRGVARMAKLMGVACNIFVPAGTAASRIADIEVEGAEVIVVDGSYDDAILRSAEEADDNTIVVSDTSWEGYSAIPREVGHGYSTMFREIDQALAANGATAPSVVAFQAGVGSFAAAGLVHYRSDAATTPPRTVIVEPLRANCLLASARAGAITEAPPPHDSTMAGLNCGLPSQLAWPIIDRTADVFVAIDDDAADVAMRAYAESGIVAGESGAASLGGLLAIVRSGHADARAAAGLLPDATVLLINTEWATDPVNYEAVVGTSPQRVQGESDTRRQAAGVVQL
ncbi:diaminopropionate ammonia-lyase [Microbacterium alcoholitolerans]|uniref:diaminopropionate ammonia-lyase n=1 Tax=unclassified Microbacterium TaxID=2609290 RepID=UPI003D17CB40